MFKDSRRRIRDWWADLTGRQQIGYGLAAAGVLWTLALALLRGVAVLSTGWALLVAVVGVVFQGGAAFVFGTVGKADPTHAQSSVRHLLLLQRRSQAALMLIEATYEQDPPMKPQQLRERLGQLSVHLSFISDDAGEAIADWELFHEKAVTKARSKTTNDGDTE